MPTWQIVGVVYHLINEETLDKAKSNTGYYKVCAKRGINLVVLNKAKRRETPAAKL